MQKKLVAIAVPLSKARQFSESEKISLAHIDEFLGEFPRYFLAPPGNTLSHPGFKEIIFPQDYFGSAAAHNRLMLSSRFYSTFSQYEFILIHHLDSLVFNDQLQFWCEQGYDLIAPPWIPGPDVPWLKEQGVGNGGLSLRRVSSFRKVLASKRLWREPQALSQSREGSREAHAIKQRIRSLIRQSGIRNRVSDEIRRHIAAGYNEDRFWWKSGQKYYAEFNIAPVEQALQFGFESNPRKCLELNEGKMPFGCHAWERFDRDFWVPFLLASPPGQERASSSS